MFRKTAFVSITAFVALQAGGALAHPSPNILQAGGAKGDRVALTGVDYKRENSVGVYRGRAALLGEAPVATSSKRKKIKIVFADANYTCHPPARLRTQGFYSGNGTSYPFTQGFHAGQRVMRR